MGCTTRLVKPYTTVYSAIEMSTLTIISHTEHYKTPEGHIVGLGSTVTEINHLLDVFDAIVHVAMLHDVVAPPSALPYISNKITFIALPAVGGPKLTDKLAILFKAPKIVATIKKAINQTDYFQFRAPTGIGVFVIPYLMLFSSKKGWFKYAGNWKQERAPLAYRFQKKLLIKQKRMVTINGHWDDQPNQCLSFENPCLTQKEYLEGVKIRQNKYEHFDKLNFCFVGRLETEKGIEVLIESLSSLSVAEKKQIGIVHIVGVGSALESYKTLAEDVGLKFKFHGLLSRHQVKEVYKASHSIVLPSTSEGFPKVITEAMNYGCIPIVSNVSAIGQYIQDEENGLLLSAIDVTGVTDALRRMLNKNISNYMKMTASYEMLLKRFTYSYYNDRIVKEVVKFDSIEN